MISPQKEARAELCCIDPTNDCCRNAQIADALLWSDEEPVHGWVGELKGELPNPTGEECQPKSKWSSRCANVPPVLIPTHPASAHATTQVLVLCSWVRMMFVWGSEPAQPRHPTLYPLA